MTYRRATKHSSYQPLTWAWLVAVYVLVMLGFGLRLFRLGYQSIWWDEAWVAHLVKGGIPAVLALPAGVAWRNPPLHESIELVWTQLAGFSEMSLRFPSLLAGVLLLPVTYRLACMVFDRATALTAVGITALSPTLVVYSQEARVYALLPVLYLLLLYTLHQVVRANGPGKSSVWLKLALIETLLIYAHFFGALGILYANSILLIVWVRQRRISLTYWMGSQLLALILFAPWLANLALHWDNIRSDVAHGNDWLVWANPQPQIVTAIGTVINFFFTAIPNLAETPRLLQWAIATVGITCAFAFGIVRLRGPQRRQIGLIAAHSLVPLGMYFVIWRFWPILQPRHALIFFAPLLITMGHITTVLLKTQGVAGLLGSGLALSVILFSALALRVQYFDERYFKDDARGVAAYLEPIARPGDAILVGPNDHAVSYYYEGPASLEWAVDTSFPDKAQQIRTLTSGGHHLFVVDWNPSNADLHRLRPFLLSQAGALVAQQYIRGFTVSTWFLEQPVAALPELTPVEVRFGPLALTGIAYPQATPLSHEPALVLHWRRVGEATTAYRVQVGLLNPGRQVVASTDQLLLDEAGLPAHWWQLDEETSNFYVVPITQTVTSGVYSLTIKASDGFLPLPVRIMRAQVNFATTPSHDALLIRNVRLTEPQLPSVAYPAEATIGSFARLVGYDQESTQLTAGQPFYVRLYWQAQMAQPLKQSYTVFTQLLAADGHLIAQHDGPPANYLRPTTAWRNGEIIVDEHLLTFSEPDYTGSAMLIVGLYDSETGERLISDSGEDHVTLSPSLQVKPAAPRP